MPRCLASSCRARYIRLPFIGYVMVNPWTHCEGFTKRSGGKTYRNRIPVHVWNEIQKAVNSLDRWNRRPAINLPCGWPDNSTVKPSDSNSANKLLWVLALFILVIVTCLTLKRETPQAIQQHQSK